MLGQPVPYQLMYSPSKIAKLLMPIRTTIIRQQILGKVGCAFVAPTSGVIDEVNRVDRFTWKTNLGADRGGLSISMIGDDGVRYYGSHLSFIPLEMVNGLRVNAGDLIGKLGASGDAKGTAPHVHCGISWPTPAGIWWVRRGELYPWKYLDAWKAGKDV